MTEKEREELIETIKREILRLVAKRNCIIAGIAYNENSNYVDEFDICEASEHARAALAVAEPVIREQCARIADEEANAMEEQLDNIIEKGTLGGRLIPNKFKRIFAHERKILIEGYEQIAAAIREGGKDEQV